MYVDAKIKTKKYKETIAFLTYLQIFKIIIINLMLLKFKNFNIPSTSRELYNLS